MSAFIKMKKHPKSKASKVRKLINLAKSKKKNKIKK